MGVYIKGMKMPKCCDECPIGEYEDSEWFSCSLMDMAYRHITQCDRLDDCPLVEVTEPHGRLIDEDNVIDAIHERLQTLQTHKEFIKKREDIDLLGVLPYISKIQTVIEAEASDD